jgi:hypothetical protein
VDAILQSRPWLCSPAAGTFGGLTIAETFQYDAASRVTSAKHIDAHAYSPVGHLQTATRGSSVAATYKYDTADECFASALRPVEVCSVTVTPQP